MIDLARMPWLPDAPEDFRARCKESGGETDPALRLRWLASHRLDLNQLTVLGKTWQGLDAKDGLTPITVGVVSNGTTDLMIRPIIASGLRYGLNLSLAAAPFNQVMQTVMDPDSTLYGATPDVILLALDHRALPFSEGADAAIDYVKAIVGHIRAHCNAALIFQTLARPHAPLLGNLDRMAAQSPHHRIDAFNRRLVDELVTASDLLFDVAHVAESVGLAAWQDDAMWAMGKLSFSQALVPLYTDMLARLLAAYKGRSRKCLVLDLDNTVWGGVIGDDGIDGIVLGEGSARGESFLAVQKTAVDLHQRGIVLAVCSKNDEANAKAPFHEHPEMLLSLDHIAVFKANWTDKADNLKAIAEALNFSLDALVLLDDNPAERANIRMRLPSVLVPEVAAEPADYPSLLLWSGAFESLGLTPEDRQRTDHYKAEAQRVTEKEGFGDDLDAYLASLNMRLTVAPFRSVDRKRVTQLINKSNQFNLTTRRYDDAEVVAMEAAEGVHGFSFRLADKFGEAGIISVVICRDQGETLDIDSWIMSCRVLGRRVENAVLAYLQNYAARRGYKALTGRFAPSGRNELVRDHYERLGFSPTGAEGDATLWTRPVSEDGPEGLPFDIVDVTEPE